MVMTQHEERVRDFWLSVYRYAHRVRGSVVSGYRTGKRNLEIGGHLRSLHLQGLAADVVLDEPLSHTIATDARHKLASELGVRLVIEGDHDHLQADL